MGNKNVRLSREADMALESTKHKVRQKLHKIIPKKEILNWVVGHCFSVKETCDKFWEWAKRYDTKKRTK